MNRAALKAVPFLLVLSGVAFAGEDAIPVPHPAFRVPRSNLPIVVPDSSVAYSLSIVQPPQNRHYTLKIVPAPLVSDVARAARSK